MFFFWPGHKQFCQFFGTNKKSHISFRRLFFEVKGRYLQIFNKNINFKVSLIFGKLKLCRTRSKICRFFKIQLIKINLIVSSMFWKSLKSGKSNPAVLYSLGGKIKLFLVVKPSISLESSEDLKFIFFRYQTFNFVCPVQR